MELIFTILLGFCSLAWVIGALQLTLGMARVPRLDDIEPMPNFQCPRISILVAGRDEAEKMPRALSSLLAQDYPDFEVIFANDRSTDSTAEILEQFQSGNRNLQVVTIDELPEGWLGKTHALQAAYEKSSGEWLLFTDADVRFQNDVLRRSIALAGSRQWDHLTLLAELETEGFWEKVMVSYFALVFLLNTRLWAVSNPRSSSYVGMGAFQLLRRSSYQAIGTHRRLALEVVDDVRLGQLVKHEGFRSGVGVPGPRVQLRWQQGLGNIVRGLTKNTFAVANYRWSGLLVQLGAALVLSLAPFAALFVTDGLPLLLAAIGSITAVVLHAVTAHNSKISPLYGLTHPLGGLLMAFIMLRSAVVTAWQGGVTWRGTFYPLAELRKRAGKLGIEPRDA